MRKPTRHSSGFLISLVINLILNFEMAVVAIILLVLHFMLDISVIFFWIALGIWIVPNLLFTLFLFVLSGMDTTPEYRENKNPYSNGVNKPQIPENKNPYSKS